MTRCKSLYQQPLYEIESLLSEELIT